MNDEILGNLIMVDKMSERSHKAKKLYIFKGYVVKAVPPVKGGPVGQLPLTGESLPQIGEHPVKYKMKNTEQKVTQHHCICTLLNKNKRREEEILHKFGFIKSLSP